MADDRLDLLLGGPTVRYTVPANGALLKLRLTTNPEARPRYDLRVITNAIRYKNGRSDVSVANDTTTTAGNQDGSLGRYVPTSQRWAIDVKGPGTEFVAFIRDANDNATAIIELTRTDSTDLTDLPVQV